MTLTFLEREIYSRDIEIEIGIGIEIDRYIIAKICNFPNSKDGLRYK